MDQVLPEAVRTAVVQVCRDAFYYRDDIRSLFVGAGVPPALYDRYDSLENRKAKIARFVLNDLQSLGANAQTVQRKIVEELCRMDRPHPDAPDQEKGRAALVELNELRPLAASSWIPMRPTANAVAPKLISNNVLGSSVKNDSAPCEPNSSTC